MKVFFDNPWFGSLPRSDADALLAAATRRHLAQGEILFRQGETFSESRDGFFGVARGSIKFSVVHSDGNEALLAIIEAGNWFGEVILLDRHPRTTTLVALEDTELLVISAKVFNVMMQRNTFAQAIAVLEARRLRSTFGVLADIALRSTRTRIARRLILLAHGDLTQSSSGRRTISTSQDNIAMMLGVSRTTLNKELQALAKMGAIELRYGHIEIKDMELLVEASDSFRTSEWKA
ncbi:Crp/Fnr family transcriptional regulator [Paraburkholderia sp. RP-4-7]|uniref:Crp/Fnr family transcriptional regulator n=1 Tax=Paraburkholderia polaris TaxID=2728848 RepID=A0A848IP66_9BURK|nr:Crp/Fnr family transcriptional regulator [Paraburkholderia polaris]NMM04072.1 Crp/Fnr family transcriptional regulator [Paraburkholderia polaris]